MDWFLYPAIVAAGFVAGFINSLASSGSLVSLPLLIFAGLPATVANGTNRVAIVFQAIVGTRGYHQSGHLQPRYAPRLALSAVAGAVVGAMIAVDLEPETMERVIGAVMVLMLVLMLVKPRRWIEGRPEQISGQPGLKQMIIFFFVGIYGGFIQAGVGIFILAGLVLVAGFDLMRANALKLLIVLVYILPALAVFVLNDQVNWLVGFVLAIGSAAGAWTATRLATRPNIGVWAHRLLLVVVVYSAVRLLGIV